MNLGKHQYVKDKRFNETWKFQAVVLTKTRGFEACFLINISIMSRTLEKNENYRT